MSDQLTKPAALPIGKGGRVLLIFTFTLLSIEFLDELVFGTREAAWPLIRNELHLSYTQIGLLLSLPGMVACLFEVLLGILGDLWHRRTIILGGGILFAIALIFIALSNSFLFLLFALMLIAPASGAFVSLSQASLMDSDPKRLEQNMARWTAAGSVGNVLGSLLIVVAAAISINWRILFGAMVLPALALVIILSRFQFAAPAADGEQLNAATIVKGMRNALAALRRREVQRWIMLLIFSDMMLDLLHGFLALYFVDVVGRSETEAAFAVIVWTVIGLPGDLLLIALLERVAGLTYLRWSALLILIIYPIFLLLPGMTAKLVLLGLLGLLNAGWYSILKAGLYSTMPGQSGTVMAIDSLIGMAAGIIPLLLGLVAKQFGLAATMWLLALAPVALLIALPRHRR